jgi:hypothetical protein
MTNYNEQLDNLFEDWKATSEKNGHTGFCADGLVYRGEANPYDGGVCRGEGNEDKLWAEARPRILFLLKDTHDNPGGDIREFYPGWDRKIIPHYENIAYWYYGLVKGADTPSFFHIDFWEEAFPVFNNGGVAIVNCKKQSGGTSISGNVLHEHIKSYAGFIKREIEILDPDIIVCGGGSSLIKNFVKENIHPDLEQINNWIHYDRKKNKVVIDSYHPSHRYSPEEVYSDMMSAYKEFLGKCPGFRENKRKPCEEVRAGLNNNNMGISQTLDSVTKELQAKFGKKLQVKNFKYKDGRIYVHFWFGPHDKWIEIWDGDDLELWLASGKKDEGFEVDGISFANRQRNNTGKYYWYRASRFRYNPKNEAEVSELVADAVAVLNDLVTYRE